MHSSFNRAQTVFGFLTSCGFAVAAVIAVLSLLPFPAPTSSPTASISVRDVQVVKGRPNYYSPKREEYAQIRFDLNANVSSLFNWNTKQVFLYVTANYPSDTDDQLSEAVIWDHIIAAPPSPFAFQSLKAKYWDKPTKPSRSKSKKTSGLDKKAQHGQLGVISLKNQRPKYQITDPSGKLSERSNVTLQLGWQVQPWVGALIWHNRYFGRRVGAWETADKSGLSDVFAFPPLKGPKSSSSKEQSPISTPETASSASVIEEQQPASATDEAISSTEDVIRSSVIEEQRPASATDQATPPTEDEIESSE
ncbi:hypothetical protein DV735_g1810, partial [Chaetothyriales sp. CBS 134920]